MQNFREPKLTHSHFGGSATSCCGSRLVFGILRSGYKVYRLRVEVEEVFGIFDA